MVTLAIDAGTSSLKVLRHTPDQGTLALDRLPHRGIDIDAWLDAIAGTIMDHGDGVSIERIAVTGQMHGLVTREGNAWGEPIPWTDQRGSAVLDDLRSRIDLATLARLGGPLAGGFLSVSLAWIAGHDPGRHNRIERVFLPKDALVAGLTGEHVTDPTDAAGTGLYDIAAGTWSQEMLEAIGIHPGWLPRIVPSASVVGQVTTDAAARIGVRLGTPVVIAGGDAAVGALGGGAVHPGDALILLSSGAQVILPDGAFTPDPDGRWYTWPSTIPDRGAPFLRMGTLLNAGNVVEWANANLAHNDLFRVSPTTLIALPHLIGERAPAGDSVSRGAIFGVTEATSGAEMRHALLEGVSYGLRQALEAMTEGGKPPSRVRLGGGGARHPLWPQIIADVLGIPVAPIAEVDLTVLGAAMLAEGAIVPPRLGPEITPEPFAVAAYETRFALYREAVKAIAPLSRRLAALEGGSA